MKTKDLEQVENSKKTAPKQVGRPRKPDALTTRLNVCVSSRQAENIDQARGDTSRSGWIRQAIEWALGRKPHVEPQTDADAPDELPDCTAVIVDTRSDN